MYFKHVQFHYAKTLSLKALPFEFASKKSNHIIGSLLTRIQHNQQGFASEDAAVVTCVGGAPGLQCAGHGSSQLSNGQNGPIAHQNRTREANNTSAKTYT